LPGWLSKLVGQLHTKAPEGRRITAAEVRDHFGAELRRLR
jgi:hypothetical protein